MCLAGLHALHAADVAFYIRHAHVRVNNNGMRMRSYYIDTADTMS